MTPTTTPLPGNMTVPPLFGWEHVLTALVLVVVVGVVALVVLAAGRGRSRRTEWEDWLAGRSAAARGGALQQGADERDE